MIMHDFCKINNIDFVDSMQRSEGETSRELARHPTVAKSLHDCPGDDQNLDDDRDVYSYSVGKITLNEEK
jgi:hypothetical protein